MLLLTRNRAGTRLRDEADTLEPGFLHGQDGGSDALVLRIDIAADMRLRHIVFVDVLDSADGLDLVLQLLDRPVEQLLLGDLVELPVNLAGSAGAVANAQ